jgi:hypothetical protein
MIGIVLYILSFGIFALFLKPLPKSKRLKAEAVVAFLLLMGFFGFRGLSVLNDTAHYYRAQQAILTSIHRVPWFHYNPDLKFEIGFQMFMNAVGKIFPDDPYMLIILTSLIVTVSYIAFFRRYCRQILFPLFLSLGTMMLPGIYAAERQSIAIALTFVVLYLWQNKRYRLALCIAVLAFFFHKSSYIIFIPIILSRFKLTDKNVFIFFIIGLVIGLNIYALFNYIDYSDNHYVVSAEARSTAPIAMILILIVEIIKLSIYRIVNGSFEPKDSNSHVDRLFVCFALTNAVICVWSSYCLPLGRYHMYFAPYSIVLFCRAITMARPRVAETMKIVSVIVAMFYCSIVITYRNEWHHMVPYSFYDYSDTHRETYFGY